VEELQQLALGDVALEDFAKVLYLGHAAQRGRRAHAAPRAPGPRAAAEGGPAALKIFKNAPTT